VGNLLVRGDVGNVKALLQLLRILKAQVKFLLQRVGILISTHGDIACKKRIPAVRDHNVHNAGADIEQRRRLLGGME